MIKDIRNVIGVTAVICTVLLNTAPCGAETSSDELDGLYVGYGQNGDAITLSYSNDNNYRVKFRVRVAYHDRHGIREETFQGEAGHNTSGTFGFRKIEACTYKAPCFDEVTLLYVRKSAE